MGDFIKDGEFKLTIFGARGSGPVSGKEFDKYGGDSSSYMIEAGGEKIFLDAGTGIMKTPKFDDMKISVLFSHLHIDHLIGLPFFWPLLDKDRTIDVYCVRRMQAPIKNQLNGLFVPPFWPCRIDDYKANVRYFEPVFPFNIGEVVIDGMEGNHPGGSTIFKISYGNKSVVYMTDYEHDEKGFSEELKAFVKDADLLLYDATYTKDEYHGHEGYGHSYPEKGIELKDAASVKRMIFVHHSPDHTDEFMDNEIRKLTRDDVSYAIAGMIVDI